LIGAATVAVVAPATAALADPSAAEVQQQIDKQSSDLEKIVENYNKVTEEVKATQANADALAAKMAPLQQTLDAAYASVGQIAVRAYKGGGVSPVAVLLSDGSTGGLLDQLSSLDHIAKAQNQEIAQYARTKSQYDEEKKKLDALLNQQRTDQKNLADQKTKIEADLANLMELRRKAFGSATAAKPPPTAPPANVGVSGGAAAAVKFAYGMIGVPYVYSGASRGGVDCSGLTMLAWQAGGRSLPHNAAMQFNSVTHISASQLQPGDLVFYSGLGHVAIYVGNGSVIHAPQPGEYVKIANVNMMSPYGYGRP
jgi:cell wall-associated NlpC family hydrolase